jgi:multiple sugar transport system substrate-binding protein
MVTRTAGRSLACGALILSASLALSPTTGVSRAAVATAPSGEVVWALPADPNAIKASQKQADLFHQMHPAITIKILQIPNNTNYDIKVQTLIAGGAPPDLFGSGDVILPTLFQKGYARDLTPYINRDHYSLSDFFQEEFRAFRYKGDIYALTDNWDTQVMYYNKDLFRKDGVAFPNKNWTWNDFRAAAIKLTHGSGSSKQYGAVFTSWFAPVYDLIWSYGGDIFSADGKSTLLNQPAAEQAIQWLADLYLKDKVSPTPSMLGSNGPDLRFMSGRAAMMIDGGRWWAAEFVGPPGITKFDWAAAPIPKGPKGRANFFHISCYIVARNAKNPDAAWEFLKFLLSKQGIAIVAADQQGIPSRVSLAHDPSFTKDPTNVKHDLVQPWFDSLPTVHAAPMIINFNQAQSLIDTALNPVWRGQTTAKAAMDSLAPKLNAELRSPK